MTTEEFLGILREHSRGKWTTNVQDPSSAMIRWADRENTCKWCPITWVCFWTTGEKHGLASWVEAAADLGLSREEANALADAADDRGQRDKNHLRASLLDACGL